MFFGPFSVKGHIGEEQLFDLTRREYLMLIPLGAATLCFGIFPQPVLSMIDPFARTFADFVLTTGKNLTLKL
jgi:NADH:ubiquinone oxidoreductase subunit 4 (subunit M)